MTKQSHKIIRCTNCVLPETFPGIKFNEEGICNLCLSFKGKAKLKKKKQEYRIRFEDLIQKYKGKSTYDSLISYSGGKDSTYTLAVLKESYGLNILAVTFDNGFLPERTFKNIKNVVGNLGIDHILFKPRFDVLKKIFAACANENIFPPQTLRRASSICTSCMAIVKFNTLRIALEKDIPFIMFGWSPGQIPITSSIMKNNPKFLRLSQKSLYDPLHKLVGSKINPYFLEEKNFEETYHFPYNISPLVFLDYDENQIVQKINEFGWEAPKDVDAHSTNCLLNSFANVVHKERHGYHPYVFELAKLVREGYLDRSVALQKLSQLENIKTVELVKRTLGQLHPKN